MADRREGRARKAHRLWPRWWRDPGARRAPLPSPRPPQDPNNHSQEARNTPRHEHPHSAKAAWDPSTPNAGDYARAAWAAQPPAKPKRRGLRAILIFVAGFVLGGLSGHSAGSAPAAVAPQPAAVVAQAPAPAAPEPAAPAPAAPAPAAPEPAAPAP